MTDLEKLSIELKKCVSVYNTQWFLGNLSGLMQAITNNHAQDQLGKLSSPMRQLYFLGGLLMSSNPSNGIKIQYSHEEWDNIIELLIKIELEYDKIFLPKEKEEINEEWIRIRKVAIPSFLSYFNQGPLNFEEQTIDWIYGLYSDLDALIENETGLKTKHFLKFYENLDKLVQNNFQGFFLPNGKLRLNWEKYTKMSIVPADHMPSIMNDMFNERRPLMTFVADHGIINRFYPDEITSDNLNIEQVNKILSFLTSIRKETDFIYYTETKPGNPLYEKPIIDIGDGMYQVFEEKQVLHAIDNFLEIICSKTQERTTKLIEKKGKLLEKKVLNIFKLLLGKECKIFTSYYIDECEQDILILWKNHAFIIEAKGYKLKEPFRDPNRAFVRIKNDFKNSIGYGYRQTRRVEEKFINQEPLNIKDKTGKIIETIDTIKYKDRDFSIIVNLKSFGQIQNDLSLLLEIEEEDVFPWVVKLDDLETFILTIIAKKKEPTFFVNYILMREQLHGKLICSDELEICGGFFLNKINDRIAENPKIIITTPDLTTIFDEQYRKGMGFENEKLLEEKKSGKYLFWG